LRNGLVAGLRACKGKIGLGGLNLPLDTLLQGGWLLAATVVAGGFNYLANVLVGKLLGPEEYGAYAALLALSLVLGAPVGVIQTVVANYTARLAAASSDLGSVGALLKSARRTLLPWAIGGALLIALGSGIIATFLHIPSAMPVIVLGCSLLPTALLPVALGALQGLQRFGRFGGGQIATSVSRLGLGVGLILLGWGVSGALAGGVLAGLGTFLLGWWWLRDVHSAATEAELPAQPHLGNELSRFSTIVAFSTLAYMLLMNGDTITVKSRFPPLEAGLYSAVATVGRIVLFVPGAVVGLMLPRVAEQHARGRPTAALARRSQLATLGLCGLGALAFLAFPGLIMRLLFGAQFMGEAALLAPYGIAMLLLALVNVWTQYFLAVQESRYALFLLTGASLLLVALFAVPLSRAGVVWALIACNGGLVLAGEWLLRHRKAKI